MYNRTYGRTEREKMNLPPDYSGSMAVYRAVEEEKKPETAPEAPKENTPEAPSFQEARSFPETPSAHPETRKDGGILSTLLSSLSPDDLIIYGIVLFIALGDRDDIALPALLLLTVLL